ncbi:MAG: zf-HC2 domain-containing protein [Abditibacteriota bacterium]|nr:zf-HC2 domain-containing protein [Abditibacteriota bacterium]
MMDCHRVKNLLNAYIDRELDARTEAAVKRHLIDCDSCYGEYLSFVSVKAAVANVEEAHPSEDFCNRLKNMFEDDAELHEQLKHVKCICRRRHAVDLSVFRKHSGAFAVVAAVAVAAGCVGIVSAVIQPRSPAPPAVAYTRPVPSETPEAVLRRAGVYVYVPTEESGETRYRMRERLLIQNLKKSSVDPYKLYCVAYGSR